MNTEFWLERWKKSEIGFHQQDINNHLQKFWPSLNPEPDSCVFVPLCGKSRDMLWLRGQNHTVLGAEISPIAVAGFFSENGLAVHTNMQDHYTKWEADGIAIFQGDFFQLTTEAVQTVGYVFDRASLIALPPELRKAYVRQLLDILPDKAKILLITFEYDQGVMVGPPFSVEESEIRRLYGQQYEIKQLYSQDVLDGYPQFRSCGLQYLAEKVYLLTPQQK